MSKLPISMCLIVKNEPKLENCILSFYDYIDDIIIIDTGSNDNLTVEIAKKYATHFEIYTDCNDPQTGLIEDFSQARNYAISKAKNNAIMWCDADDIIEGAENLERLINSVNPNNELNAFMFPYEYSFDENGACSCRHYRERLFLNKNKIRFANPVHEVAIPNDGVTPFFIQDDSVVYKHQRQYINKTPETGRNLRILRKYFEKHGDSDARQLYYLGLELFNANLIDEAIEKLTKYIEVSGWEDEKYMACLKLIDIYFIRNDIDNVLKWAFKAITIKENWAEAYFALGKAFYTLAEKHDINESRYWERCAFFIRTGLALPETKTLLFINPLERQAYIHQYYNMALNKIGDYKGALDSVNSALKVTPNNPQLLNNKKIYEDFIDKNEFHLAVNKLKNNNVLNNESYDFIINILNEPNLVSSIKTTILNSVNNESIKKQEVIINNNWNIPVDLVLDTIPLNLEKNQLESVIIMLWKQFILHEEVGAGISLLENGLKLTGNSPVLLKAIKETKLFLDPKQEITISVPEGKLDIVFFIGDGVEEWNPETVKKTGIGGSELMALNQAKNLAALGHKVRLYNSCGINGEGIYDGVEYLQTAKFINLNCDVLVTSRRADVLDNYLNINARLKLLWIHDLMAMSATNERLLKADRILALTEWHKSNIVNAHNVHPQHVLVTRNAIDLIRFNKKVKRNRFKCINSSSPDRSWPILLDNIWPEIKKQVPEAELHLFYGFKNFEYSIQFNPGLAGLRDRLFQRVRELESLGVTYHDRVNQDILAEEMLSAGTLLFPTWFSETSCITAMEAQAAGLRIISSSIAALNETVGQRGILIDGEWTSPEYHTKFIDAAVKALTNEDDSDRLVLQQYAKDNFGLIELAKDWETMFYSLLDELKINPIVPYQPTIPYR